MTAQDLVITSRVRLARNYEDLPFSASADPELADECIRRTVNAFSLSGEDAGFDLIRLSELTDVQRRSLAESHLVSADLLKAADTAAVLLSAGEATSVMMNEEDHLRIQSICAGMALTRAADKCFAVDDALSRQVRFAFDAQLGYLTSCPTNTGTGMRASLLVHLPMLTRARQIGTVGQIAAKVGLTLRGVFGASSEALGSVYQVSNQVTLGRTEQEIISTVDAVAVQLTDMEADLARKTLEENRAVLEDVVLRADALLRAARILPLKEFFSLWSSLRLGVILGMVDLPLTAVDALLEQGQDAHVQAWAEQPLKGAALDTQRASRVRELLAAAGA